MSAAVTFLLSLSLLTAFVLLRFWEEKRGVKAFAPFRKSADEVVSEMYKGAITGNISTKYRAELIHFLHTLTHDTVVFLVEGLRALERPLTRLSYRMRQSAPPPTTREPSEFLKTITPDKKGEGKNPTNTI